MIVKDRLIKPWVAGSIPSEHFQNHFNVSITISITCVQIVYILWKFSYLIENDYLKC